MRELHVVATSEDGRHVVLATRKGAASGDYRVALDERLAAAVRGDLPRPGETEPAVVTPKEIQARLRAGESPEEIAASAGVPVTKIDRYAGPVLSERERVLGQARAGFVSRSRLGESALPLGEAVDRHLADTTGVRLETVEWSTRREEGGTWLVELSYVSQARRRSAVWRYDVVRREVTATDSASAALAHVEPSGRRSRPSDTESVAGAPVRTPARTAGRSGSRRSAPVRDTGAAAPKAPAARTVAARPTPPVRAAAPVPKATAPAKAAQTAATRAAAAASAGARTARAAAQERAAKAAAADAAKAAATAKKAAQAEAARVAKAAAAEQAAEREAAEKARKKAEKAAKDQAAREKAAAEKAAEKAAAEKAAADAAAAAAEAARVAEQEPVGPPTLRVVGSEEAPAAARRGPKAPPAAARTAPARAAGQRASVPGWADVLLSTAPVARPAESEPDSD